MKALKGTVGEYTVALDMLKRGFPVFVNLAPCGVDMVVQSGENFYPVEATSGVWKVKASGERTLTYQKHLNTIWVIMGIVTPEGIRYVNRDQEEVIPESILT